MNIFTSKSIIFRHCLTSIVLLCCVLTSKNAFSMPWKEAFRQAYYDRTNGTVNFKILSYYHNYEYKTLYNYLNELNIEYSEDSKLFNPLLTSIIDFQESEEVIWAKMKFMKVGERIDFPSAFASYREPFQWVRMDLMEINYKDKQKRIALAMHTYLEIKWKLPRSIKSIKSLKISGKWCESVLSKHSTKNFKEIISLEPGSSSQKAPKEWKNDMKVTVKADIITVTGLNAGENIKVYNADTWEVVKSVIAQNEVEVIKLPKNQLYVVLVGEKRIKVAL